MAPKEPKGIAARNVSFSGPPVPKFLQKLHKEVNGARSTSHKSEFDDMLGTSVHRSSAADEDDDKEEQPEEDEFDGAQVVVLKEGKHLSKEQVLAGKAGEAEDAGKGKGKEQAAAAVDEGSVAQPGASSSKKRRAPLAFDEDGDDTKKKGASSSGGDALADVKALIGESKSGSSSSKADKAAAKAEKKARKEKKKQAAIKIPAMAMDGDEEEADFEQAGDEGTAGEINVTTATAAAASGDDTNAEGEEEQEEEVEALSHKEQRKRRKLEKAAAKAGVPLETLLPSKSKGSKASAAAPSSTAAAADGVDAPKWGPKAAAAAAAAQAALPRTGYSLWVGNLSFRTTSERLTEWFVEQGLEGVTRVYMPAGAKRGEANKGFAYVDVPDAATVKAGIALSEGHLEGRRLLIKSGNDYAGRPALDATAVALATIVAPTSAPGDADAAIAPKQGKTGLTKTAQKILRAQKNPPAPTLFVGNLSFQATSDGLRELIENAARARDNSQWNAAKRERGEKKKVDKDADLKGTPEPEAEKPAGDEDVEMADVEEEASDAEGEEKPKEKKGAATAGAKKQAPAKEGEIRGAGIRKIRMGEFEDSGKCKGFAFVDFFTPAHATATLIDPRCTRLDGRDITLQYAGADAVRRGAVKGSAGAASSGVPSHRSGARPWAYGGERPAKRTRDDAYDAHAPAAAAATEEILGPAPPTHFDPDAPVEKVHKPTREERLAKRAAEAAAGRGAPQRRAKPGAALANAQRGQTGIVEGAPVKKITFD